MTLSHHFQRLAKASARHFQNFSAQLGIVSTPSKNLQIENQKQVRKMATDTHEPILVEVSTRSVVRAAIAIMVVLLGAYLLYSIADLLLLLFLGLFFAATLDPAVDWLENRKIPRWLGVFFLFFLALAALLIVIGSVVPVMIEQITEIATSIGESAITYFQELQSGRLTVPFLGAHGNAVLVSAMQSLNVQAMTEGVVINLNEIASYLQSVASGSLVAAGKAVSAGVSAAGSVASFLFQFTLVLFFTFFMVVDKRGISSSFQSLFPASSAAYVSGKIAAVQQKIGAWTRGQLALSLIMFMLGFAGLLFIGMKYAITLAMVLAIGEFLPYVGPILFLAFSLPIALNLSIFMVIKLLVLYAVLQFLEGNIVMPVVMEKAVGLSPIVVMLALLIGFQFLGIIGAIIAVPVATAIAIFVNDYLDREK